MSFHPINSISGLSIKAGLTEFYFRDVIFQILNKLGLALHKI